MEGNKIILVVEDEPMLLQNITSILDMHGFTTIQASNGAEGLLLAKERQPNLILSDMMMDNMDGFQLLSLLKQDSLTQHIPFIFLTARADIRDKDDGMAAGAVAYLTKPFSGKELVNVVRQFL